MPLPPRSTRSYSEKEIASRLKNPEIDKIRNELTSMADDLRREDATEEGDDSHMQRRSTQSRGRGPMANRQQDARVNASTETTDRILRSLSQMRGGVDFGRGKPEAQEQTDEEENDLPPPRPRPSGPGMVPQDQGLLTNADAYFPKAGSRNADQRMPAPDISRIQKLELELENLKKDSLDREKGKRVPTEQPTPGKLRFARKAKATPEGFQKVDLQSDCLFYDFPRDEFLLRPVDAATQVLISNAKQAKNGVGDESMLFDALQNCTTDNIDLRQLTYPDLYYVLMWLQFNSYPNVPFDIDWTSKYGNLNRFTLENHNLRYLRIGASREDVARWRGMGLDYPRVTDREILNSDLEKEDLDVYRRAQYFAGETPEDKVEAFYAASAQTLAEYPKMMDKCNHGIFDSVDLVDQHFDPAVQAQRLRDSADKMEQDSEKYKEDPEFYLSLMGEVEGLRTQAETIETSLKNGVRVEPDAERITLVFSPLAFFPVL